MRIASNRSAENGMPDVKPRPRAGAIRLSVIRADQKGMRSASVLEIIACIPIPRIDSRPAPESD